MRLKGLVILKKNEDFQYNKCYGLGYFGKKLILQISRSSYPSLNKIFVGFIVSKKVGKAVKRNLIKRRLRVITQKLLINEDSGKNYVLIAKKSASDATFTELKQDLLFCLKKVREHNC
ncbi:MAG: ribonuclease P protein component [Rickettsiaceae bacterium H1]|nr:ribonuclease P protein component [Rickettsiaceae bacterium H1]